jgi:hypothetical protein
MAFQDFETSWHWRMSFGGQNWRIARRTSGGMGEMGATIALE